MKTIPVPRVLCNCTASSSREGEGDEATMMSHYYNEFNPESAAMLRQFMADGLIPHGIVDPRPIQEVRPDDLKGYTQCHFFAGVAGWQFALQLAGWPEDRPVWTGSCPCQPFSAAGRQKGKVDDRHLWPVWFRLIEECEPDTIFGEQVASAVTYGWLDDVYEGLEAQNYAVGAVVLPASSVGAPHKRDRLWFVADTRRKSEGCKEHGFSGERQDTCDVADTDSERLQGHRRLEQGYDPEGWEATQRHSWSSGVWIDCPDGKQRLVESSIPLLVDGFQHRKPILHALGNAIVPQVAAEFIIAFMEA